MGRYTRCYKMVNSGVQSGKFCTHGGKFIEGRKDRCQIGFDPAYTLLDLYTVKLPQEHLSFLPPCVLLLHSGLNRGNRFIKCISLLSNTTFAASDCTNWLRGVDAERLDPTSPLPCGGVALLST